MGPHAVIFDLDGTLLDTLDDLTASTNAALRAFGLPPRSRDEVRAYVGNGYARLISRAVPERTDAATVEGVHAAFMAHYAAHGTDATAPYPGVLGLLAQLRAHGVSCAVVSNKGDRAVQTLARHFFPGMLAAAVGERRGVRRKPAPDAVHAVMRELGVRRDECVYVGDSEVDVETATAAELPCIAVSWGFRSRDQLCAAGATSIADDCEELLTLLRGDTPARMA